MAAGTTEEGASNNLFIRRELILLEGIGGGHFSVLATVPADKLAAGAGCNK